jgi:GDPmannose 4,6-dehydratase
MAMKRALICGVTGQDGAYLARFLLDKGYEVFGTSRDAQAATFTNLHALKIGESVHTLSMAINDFRSVLQALCRVEPDEVYNLSGQSSVGLSFEQPVETMESISLATLNLLEAIRFLAKDIRLYSAGSSECFGNTWGRPANEETPFRPCSPYAVAKAAAYWQVANYRASYKLYACTGILFNHESPLRPERYVTRKIVIAAHQISMGVKKKLYLGNLNVIRDWGWAPEYVEAMWKMLQQDSPDDYVIATGRSCSLKDFVRTAFTELGLDWEKYVEIDPSLLRPTDLIEGNADPKKAAERLGWAAKYGMTDVVQKMLSAELHGISSSY